MLFEHVCVSHQEWIFEMMFKIADIKFLAPHKLSLLQLCAENFGNTNISRETDFVYEFWLLQYNHLVDSTTSDSLCIQELKSAHLASWLEKLKQTTSDNFHRVPTNNPISSSSSVIQQSVKKLEDNAAVTLAVLGAIPLLLTSFLYSLALGRKQKVKLPLTYALGLNVNLISNKSSEIASYRSMQLCLSTNVVSSSWMHGTAQYSSSKGMQDREIQTLRPDTKDVQVPSLTLVPFLNIIDMYP
jgi:hypothetical protein